MRMLESNRSPNEGVFSEACGIDTLKGVSMGSDDRQTESQLVLENTFIYLFGFPEVGKYTIAQEIARQAGVIVVDNQLINMPIFTVLKPDGVTPLPPDVWDKVSSVWDIVFDTIIEIADPAFSFVLTNVLLHEEQADQDRFRKVAERVSKRDGTLLPVRLLCDLDENKRRIVSPDRNERLKTISSNGLERLHEERSILTPDHPHTTTLDVTELGPEETASRIVEVATDLDDKERACHTIWRGWETQEE